MMLSLAVTLAALTAAQADFFVAPTGDDGNPGTEEAPFATIGRAQQAVRERIGGGLEADVTVLIRGGRYELAEPLVFNLADSGTAGHAVVYAAYPGETPVFSGGRIVSGWRKGEGGRWTAAVEPGWGFRQLFAGGERLPRGRFPNAPDLLRVESVGDDVKTITFPDSFPGKDLAAQSAELVMYQNWSISRGQIASAEGGTVQLVNPMGWIGHGPATTASPHKPAYLENALEFVDQPGEWYLDSENGVLTYMAAPGEDPNTREFVAPLAPQLVRIEGEPGRPVRNLHLRGLVFEHTSWELPSFGYHGIQAGHHGTNMKEPTHVLPVAVEMLYAADCGIERCRIRHTGASAVGLGQQSAGNRVEGCIIEDIGGNGVMVGWRGKGEITGLGKAGNFHLSGDWQNAEDVPLRNAVVHNVVRECGAVCHGAVGIYDAFCAETRIAHNVVSAMPYTGISVGFRWNMSDTSQRGTQVEYNHVFDTMRMLADGGCLYTLGYQPGTVIRGNVFHNVHRSSFAHGGAPNNGIFFDQGSKGYLVEGNTIYDTSGKPIRFNQTSAAELTWGTNSFGAGPDFTTDPAAAAKWR